MKKFRPVMMSLVENEVNHPPPISGPKAAEEFAENPGQMAFSFTDIMRVFRLTEKQLHAELLSGRLVASGIPGEGGQYRSIAVQGNHLLEWMVLTGRDKI